MKIYVDSKNYPSVEFDTKHTRTLIYTNDGIYCYKKELQKMEFIENIREKDYKNHHFFIDTTTITYTDTIYHIPYFHLFCQEEIEKKNIGDGIFLVKVIYFDQVDYYFETDRNDELLYDDIITFLSTN